MSILAEKTYPKGYNMLNLLRFYTLSVVISKFLCIFAPERVYNMSNNLSSYVKEMRRQFGLTQVDLAAKSGVGLRFVRELEQGKETLRLDKVNLVLLLFGQEVGPVPIKRED